MRFGLNYEIVGSYKTIKTKNLDTFDDPGRGIRMVKRRRQSRAWIEKK